MKDKKNDDKKGLEEENNNKKVIVNIKEKKEQIYSYISYYINSYNNYTFTR